MDLITQFKNTNISVFFNGRKDSIVLLDLLSKVYNLSKIPIVFILKKNEFPEILNYIDYICKLYFCGNEIQTYQNRMGPEFWHYNSISKNIINEILDSDKCLDVYEKISYGDGNKEIFEYKINKKNLESISKAKVFYYY